MRTRHCILLWGFWCITLSAATADQQNSGGTTGDTAHTTQATSAQTSNASYKTYSTAKQQAASAGTYTSTLGGQYAGQTMFNLPQTSLDSFVYEAGANAELIYGDEGTDSIPPYFSFDSTHRISQGITGARAVGLTTGHGSYLPDAWGGDEFVQGPEFSQSGSTSSGSATVTINSNYSNANIVDDSGF